MNRLLGRRVESTSELLCIISIVVLWLFCGGAGLTLSAQTIGGASISGTIADQSGAVVPGAVIKIEHVETGITRSLTTGPDGSYRASGLPVGDYVITVEKQGFTTQVQPGVQLTVGQQAVLNFTETVSRTEQAVTVSANASQLETTTSTVSGLVGEKEIRDLPLNGRDYTQLTLLQPGATSAATSGSNPLASSGGIARYTVNGIRPTGNNFLLDGLDVNDPSFNLPFQGVSGLALGTEGVQEFRILTSTYTAQYGRNAGAIVNAITRSGSNGLHGSVYEFLRNDNLDARNFFDPPGKRPEFKRNDFGFTLGGPIIRKKTFFFANYEGFRERLGVTTVATVPDENARKGIIPVFNPATGQREPTNVGVAPGVKPFLDLYPLPNGPNNGDGSAQFFGSDNQPTDENFYLVRLDHSLSPKDHLFVRYNLDVGSASLPFSNTPVPGFPTALARRNLFLTPQYQKILSNNLINEVRFGFTSIKYGAFPNGNSPVSISLRPGPEPLGTVALQGVSPLGFSANTEVGASSNIYQLADDVSYNRGKHFITAGINVERLQISSFFEGNALGSYNVGSLQNFLTGKSVNYLGVPSGGTSLRDWRQTKFEPFVQDDFKVLPSLTLNLGLRWEYATVPDDINGRNTNIRNPATDSSVTLGQIFENPTPGDVAPRFGFSWVPPIGDRKTVIRGGIGKYYDFIWENIYGNTRFQPPFFLLLFTPNAPFPTPPPPAGGLGLVAPQTVDFHLKNPYALQFNFNIQRELDRNTVVTVGYVGTRGHHLFRVYEANTKIPTILPDGTKFFPPDANRRNPNFSTIRQRSADADSNYNALQAEVRHRFSRGLRFQASYTYSRAIDDSAGPFQTDTIAQAANSEDPLNKRLDKGLSPFDAKHNIVVNYTYDLPFGAGQRFGSKLTGVLGKLVSGWQINGIDTFTSGHPFSIVESSNVSNNGQSGTGIADRPNLTPGFSNNPTSGFSRGCAGVPAGQKLGTPDTGAPFFFDPCAFSLQSPGFFGNLGRNTLIGPDFINFDLSINKFIKITESKRIEFRTEFFNLSNRSNFQVPSNVGTSAGASSGGDFAFDANGNRLGNAGKIFRTVNPSRQIQFALKISF